MMVAPSSLRRRISLRIISVELLGHTLGEFLHLLSPPVLNAKADEPLLQGFLGRRRAHSLELGQIHRLVAHLHFAIEAALLRHVSYLFDIRLSDRGPAEKNLSAVGYRNSVDNTYEGGLAGPVGTKQSEDTAFRYLEAHVVERHLLTKTFADLPAFDN